jgi:transglutaminase-like putative cysteine protease
VTAERDPAAVAIAVLAVVGLVTAASVAPALAADAPVSPGSGGPVDDLARAVAEAVGGEAPRPQPGAVPGGGSFGSLSLSAPASDPVGSLSADRYREQSAQTVFVVEGANTYYRLAAYGTFTGTAWQRNGTRTPDAFDQDHRGRVVTQRITLTQSATTLPAAWKPADVDADLPVSPGPGYVLEPGRPAGPGTTYAVRSVRTPNPDRAFDGPVPERVRRYSALPDAVSSRVAELTERVTTDADGPAESAAAVEAWLERTKEYSLAADHDESRPVVRQFLFEMDRGYCQYFASAMAVMLRTQGIPTRYVVGYAPGEQVEGDTYRVSGQQAHAWVEVYVAGAGWVRYDPTPAAARTEADRADGPYTVSLNRSAAPGADVTVTVARGDGPAAGVPVQFNGDTVGQTNATGALVAEVPYVRQLRVTVAGESTVPPAPRSDRPLSVRDPSNGSLVVNVSADVSVRARTAPVPGNETTFVATVGGEPMRGAAVSVDGERVGQTDRRGRFPLALPATPGATRQVAVERGEIHGERTVRVPELNVTASSVVGTALPGLPATLSVTAAGRPVGGAAVTLGETRAGVTDEHGTVGATLPAADSVTVTVRVAGYRATAPVGGLSLNAGLFLAGVAVFVGAAVGLSRRRAALKTRVSSGGLFAGITALARRLGRVVVAAVVAAGGALDRALDALTDLDTGTLRSLSVGRFAAAVTALLTWLRGVPGRATGTGDGRDEAGAADRRSAGEDTDDESRDQLRSVWGAFVRLVDPPSPRSQTPGEVARHAVERGLPAEQVYAVTDAFREVAYGDRRPTAALRERGRRALDSLKEDDR